MTPKLLFNLLTLQVVSVFTLPQHYQPFYRPIGGYYIPTIEHVHLQSQKKHADQPKDSSDASYSFNIDTDSYKRMESSDQHGNVVGSYSYTNENGTHDLSYIAGAGIGFQPTGGSLATIQRGYTNDGIVINNNENDRTLIGRVKIQYQPNGYFRIVTPDNPSDYTQTYPTNIYNPSNIQYFPPTNFYPNPRPEIYNPIPSQFPINSVQTSIGSVPGPVPIPAPPPAQQTYYPENESIVVEADPGFSVNRKLSKSAHYPYPSPRQI